MPRPRRRPADRRQPLPDPDAKRTPEPRFHRLRDWDRVRDAAAECGVSLWLHGHRHSWYVLPAGENLPFATICAGSSTQTKRWGYHEYTIDGWKLTGLRRVFDPESGNVPGYRDFRAACCPAIPSRGCRASTGDNVGRTAPDTFHDFGHSATSRRRHLMPRPLTGSIDRNS